jgi:triosephosphate isomerase
MSRRPLLAGNWKMHLSLGEAVALARSLVASCGNCTDREVMIAPAFTALAAVTEAVRGSGLRLGAQNVAGEREGAFTGEVAPPMLTDIGVDMAIVGHSERRQIFGEDDAMINRRLQGALAAGLAPVLCIGETLAEREAERTFAVLEAQLRGGLHGVDAAQADRVVLAYEPVWAIGTGKTATREQAQEAHRFLRDLLAQMYEKNIAESVRILYGGSVKPDNIDALMAQPDIDGALVGGAALKAASFERIVRFR